MFAFPKWKDKIDLLRLLPQAGIAVQTQSVSHSFSGTLEFKFSRAIPVKYYVRVDYRWCKRGIICVTLWWPWPYQCLCESDISAEPKSRREEGFSWKVASSIRHHPQARANYGPRATCSSLRIVIRPNLEEISNLFSPPAILAFFQ